MPTRPITPEQKADADRLKVIYEAWKAEKEKSGAARITQPEIAEQLGVGQSAFSQRINGRLAMNKEFAAKIASLVGCKVSDFSPSLASEIEQLTADDAEEFTLVKRADVRVSAGHGLLVFDEGSQSSLSFRRDFLRALGISPQNAVLVDVQGRSMEPTIPDGAVLLLNRADRDASRGRVYAVRHDGELLVKRMHKTATGYLAVSDNPDRNEYPDRSIIDDNGDFEIIGRAVWMGASL